ncbi:glutathione S-transferase T3-like [Arachis ipaensis]|uniref:glutathione S-transferase T3-like n=1 Tax=Arachis ipaensis TaxID=130454 RepID=UPI0007AEEC35|nr:glutathione S-transferase T3-like [Arachis ipaensis]
MIQSSPNLQYSDFANPRGLDAINLNDDDIENRRQDSIQHWHWKEDELLISAWLNVSIDPIGAISCKKKWYKINKTVAQFAGCYDKASRNIRSDSNADDIKELAYKLYSANYGQKLTFERHWNMLRLEQKWRSQLPTQSGGSKRTKISTTGAYSSSSNLETPLVDEIGVDSPGVTSVYSMIQKKKISIKALSQLLVDGSTEIEKQDMIAFSKITLQMSWCIMLTFFDGNFE